ncbi:MAG: OadG family protein [Bacteroidales bacterium]|nr:OadG family protein [Bacteroidales bacterium]
MLLLIPIAAVNSFAIIVAIVGYLTVFGSLVLLYLIFYNIPKLYKIQLRNALKKKGKCKGEDEECCVDISGQTSAAITMALYLYFNELHDQEDMVMTIKKVSKRYSPWSSKIYGLNNINYRNR